jgi:CRISPR-associated protein Csx17
MVRRLRSGDGGGALEIALRRLSAAGLRPPLRAALSNPATARLWAAALAFPISWSQAQTLARTFETTNRQEIR